MLLHLTAAGERAVESEKNLHRMRILIHGSAAIEVGAPTKRIFLENIIVRNIICSMFYCRLHTVQIVRILVEPRTISATNMHACSEHSKDAASHRIMNAGGAGFPLIKLTAPLKKLPMVSRSPCSCPSGKKSCGVPFLLELTELLSSVDGRDSRLIYWCPMVDMGVVGADDWLHGELDAADLSPLLVPFKSTPCCRDSSGIFISATSMFSTSITCW